MMIQQSQYLQQFLSVIPALNADYALCRGRQHMLWQERLADMRIESKSFQAGAGKDDRIVVAVFELLQSRIDIAPQRFDRNVASQRQ